jgi:hypothetical protein
MHHAMRIAGNDVAALFGRHHRVLEKAAGVANHGGSGSLARRTWRTPNRKSAGHPGR